MTITRKVLALIAAECCRMDVSRAKSQARLRNMWLFADGKGSTHAVAS